MARKGWGGMARVRRCKSLRKAVRGYAGACAGFKPPGDGIHRRVGVPCHHRNTRYTLVSGHPLRVRTNNGTTGGLAKPRGPAVEGSLIFFDFCIASKFLDLSAIPALDLRRANSPSPTSTKSNERGRDLGIEPR